MQAKHFNLFCFSTIRLSSPVLNNVVLFGCTLMYSEIFVRGILNNKEYLNYAGLCMVRIIMRLLTPNSTI